VTTAAADARDPDDVPEKWPRRFCCDEDLALIGYDGRDAASDLASLRSSGPRRPTQELIDVILAEGVDGSLVLDIGAGVGAIHLALLEAGARGAVDVDASREYLAAAREEARRRGLDERVEYRYGDVVELAAELPQADIVVLDSVICCYPYLPALLNTAIESRPRLLGLTYPRDTWWMRTFMRAYNATHALARSPARYFIHRHRVVRGLLVEAGYAEVHSGGLPVWRVAVYRRLESTSTDTIRGFPLSPQAEHPRLGVRRHAAPHETRNTWRSGPARVPRLRW
jgi:SAM-dependent methyltransferase